MNIKTIKTLATAACLSLSSVTFASAATVTIDDFNNTVFQVVGAPSLINPTNPATISGPTADAIGGVRTITNTRTSPAGTANAFGSQVQAVVTGGNASVSLGASTEGFSVFSWNAGGADLMDGTNSLLSLDVIDSDLLVSFTFRINGVTGLTKTTPGGPNALTFDFSDFGGVDFSSVGAISLLIEGPTSFDVTFDNVLAIGAPVSAVPVPAALPLFGTGLAIMGFVGWRRKRNATA